LLYWVIIILLYYFGHGLSWHEVKRHSQT
jgi:hypothetical protein